MAPTEDEKRKIPDTQTTDRPKKRVNKPLIEKRRRERINECLNQLQNLISQLDKDKHKVGRPAKLEKADILEMTVEFVKKTKSNIIVQQRDEIDIHQQSYMAGYRKCVDEIKTFCKDNDIPAELKTSLCNQIDLKICHLTNDEQAVDLTTKTDKKEFKISEQLHVLSNNNPAIQPKFVSQNPVSSNIQVGNFQNANLQIVQRQLNTNSGQVTVVCQKEPSTYVLVPAAAICQPIQVPSPSQSFPLIVQNGTSNFELKPNVVERSGTVFPNTNVLQNQGAFNVMLPNSTMGLPVINTTQSFPCNTVTSQSPVAAVSGASFPVSTLMPSSGAGRILPSAPVVLTSVISPLKPIVPSVQGNTTNDKSEELSSNVNRDQQSNDSMWRPW